MRGKTAKLLRKVAKTNPYNVKDITGKTLYNRAQVGNNIILAQGFRLTYKFLKKFYKAGKFTTTELRAESKDTKPKTTI